MSTIISKLRENARLYPASVAVSDGGTSLTYAQLWSAGCAFAAQLIRRGVTAHAGVMVEAVPSAAFPVAEMGVYLAHGIFIPVEKGIPADKAAGIAAETGAVLYIGSHMETGIPSMDMGDILRLSVCTPTENEPMSLPVLPAEAETADILFTTGTTGTPKGVVLSHGAVFASADNSRQVDELNEKSVYLIASPLNHTNALRKLLSCFICGSHAVLLDGFLDVRRYYDTAERYGVNVLLLPPSAVRLLLTVSRDKLHSLADRVQVVHSGSAAMPEADKEALRACLPHARLIFGYGASEAGNACAYDYAANPGLVNCVGRPNPHSIITIVDDARREIRSSRDNPGIIAIGGEIVMEGYLHDPDRTAEVLAGRTLYTNDMGYTDENGFVFVIGRRGDIINCGGLKIAPSEVEDTVMRYPGILDCACFGITDRLAGMAVGLQLVPEDEAGFDMQAFRTWLGGHLEGYKIPRRIDCVRAIPKTANGKTDRKLLH